MSFRFYALRDQFSGSGEATVRDVIEADLDDVSIVTYPAYTDTSAVAEIDPGFTGDLASSQSTRSHVRPQRDQWLDNARVRLRLAEAAGK